ncbi:Tim44 domain-containing protein [Xanthobacter agilis]|uniref:Lipid-binding transport protein (Tim44 family) n=1 Tax=Xanthobacter agilis TaxID=47492 RepID=A0ABU0LEE5_XANAG|nr:TIM44-like domain-containing protein [Xanthobacter agilis]MDQ0505484.1 putative lipid-binding transport protein (Tim44 family) [Xanthobacter agilis]
MGIRPVLAMVALVAALSMTMTDMAEAKRGMSAGSRGTRTYTAPPPTTTAPNPAAPASRSTLPQAAPSAAARPQARPSFFGSGLAGGLMRGLLIGGLIGMLMGHGLGGFAGLLGLLLQGALLALVVMLALRFFRRQQPAPAGAYGRTASPGGAGGWPGGMGGEMGGGVRQPASPPRSGPVDEIGVTPADLDTFERLLGEIETAFGGEDEAALQARTTPEVFATMVAELRANAARGVRNMVSEVKLLQGDVAESWREGPLDYATVAMRYQSRDVVLDRASGRFLSGDRDRPGQSTELWTFVRDANGDAAARAWRLAAMQPA